ncbi:MAG: hypothetical protein ACE5J7_00210 [Candidatus Aenigmatarchaeota archaeon]
MKGVELPIKMIIIIIVLLLVAIISVIVISMVYGVSIPLLDQLKMLIGGAKA